jgi:hypothetical protein
MRRLLDLGGRNHTNLLRPARFLDRPSDRHVARQSLPNRESVRSGNGGCHLAGSVQDLSPSRYPAR